MYIYILIYKLLYIHITTINAKRDHKFEESNKGYMEWLREIKGKENYVIVLNTEHIRSITI